MIIAVLFSVFTPCFSQPRALLTDQAKVQEAVTAELDALFKSDDFLKRKAKIFGGVTGSLIIDVGVVGKGKVATFFKAGGDIDNIDFVSFVSDYILRHKFNFKLNKQQRYKVRYHVAFK